MAYLPPIWFGSPAAERRLITEADLMEPVHTKVINLLSDNLGGVEVWPDISQSEPSQEAVVVMNIGGEWTIGATAKQRRTRKLRLIVQAPTSDQAERLLDKVFLILRRSETIVLSISRRY